MAVRDAAHARDAKLQKDGALMGIAGAPVQVDLAHRFDCRRRDDRAVGDAEFLVMRSEAGERERLVVRQVNMPRILAASVGEIVHS